MTQHLGGDRKPLNDGGKRSYRRVWAILALVLVAIGFAVLRQVR